jgi:hypothetical protein
LVVNKNLYTILSLGHCDRLEKKKKKSCTKNNFEILIGFLNVKNPIFNQTMFQIFGGSLYLQKPFLEPH